MRRASSSTRSPSNQWARDAAGLAPTTLDGLIKPVVEICEFYGTVPWQLSSREVDRYFAGAGKRATSTLRGKINKIDAYFAFLEQRYAGEIMRRFGHAVESPIDPFNRPRHRGDFGLRIPPSQTAMRDLFSRWREDLPGARKYLVACRDYVMTKIAYLSGVRANELCGVCMGDLHWDHGQWGRFVVLGKGAHGSGPRPREAYMFQEGRALLWWYIEEIRGEFGDDAGHPKAPLWPSERKPTAVAALNLPIAPAIVPSTFRRALHNAAGTYLTGPVTDLFPHLLRHACATHNYERGMTLWEVQKVLGHDWATTTLGTATGPAGVRRHSLPGPATRRPGGSRTRAPSDQPHWPVPEPHRHRAGPPAMVRAASVRPVGGCGPAPY